ncbi:MAG: polyprenyl synthetase family protein, partial [Micrococcales bacterium]
MNEMAVLLEAIQTELDCFMDARQAEFAEISPELLPIIDYSRDLLRGGKRFRALFCFTAWQGSLAGVKDSDDPEQLAGIVKICAALELFHAAALVHDDLIDQSDTRRGNPAMHKRFEALHSESQFSGQADRFGAAASILVGDLMLSWSSELFGSALLVGRDKEIEAECRYEFGRMRIEVMAGQYLDVLEENAASNLPLSDAVARAN